MSNLVTMEIPRPMYGIDSELDLCCSLQSVIDQLEEITTPEERERATQWLADRHSIKEEV